MHKENIDNSNGNIQNYISKFINSKKRQELSKETLSIYSNEVKYFQLFLNQNGIFFVEKINFDIFKKFFVDKIDFKKSLYSKKIALNSIKMFLAFLEEEGVLNGKAESFNSIKIITPEVKPIYYFDSTLEKIQQILNDENFVSMKKKKKEIFLKVRIKLMLNLLIYAGVKIEELLDIRLSDISVSEGGRFYHIRVFRKCRGERVIPVKKKILEESVLRFAEVCEGDMERHICSTFDGARMAKRNFAQIVENFFRKYDIEYLGLQAFRHGYAKELVAKRYSRERIKYLMGYRNMSPVNEYFKLFGEDS